MPLLLPLYTKLFRWCVQSKKNKYALTGTKAAKIVYNLGLSECRRVKQFSPAEKGGKAGNVSGALFEVYPFAIVKKRKKEARNILNKLIFAIRNYYVCLLI